MHQFVMALVALALLAAAPDLGAAQELSHDHIPENHVMRGARLTITLLHQERAEDGSSWEMAEIVFAAGYAGGDHRHPVTETFYVLEGTLEHVVNGEVTTLTPGMSGVVRPPDAVAHRVVEDQPVRAIVVWSPAGEFERITGRDLSGG